MPDYKKEKKKKTLTTIAHLYNYKSMYNYTPRMCIFSGGSCSTVDGPVVLPAKVLTNNLLMGEILI